jgi:hypothetical protein
MVDNNCLQKWINENLKSTHNQARRAFNNNKIESDMVPKSREKFWVNSR